AFRYVAYAPELFFKKILLTDDLTAIQNYANNSCSSQTSEEEVAAKLRESRAVIEHAARWRARGRVFQQWRDHSFPRLSVMNNRPAKIRAALHQIELVAARSQPFKARRAVLCLEHHVRSRLPVKALRVAAARCPDFRARAGTTDERIILRNAPVVV